MHLFGPGHVRLVCVGFNIPHSQHCATVGSISFSLFSLNNCIPPILVVLLAINFLASLVSNISILIDFLLFNIKTLLTFHSACVNCSSMSCGVV